MAVSSLTLRLEQDLRDDLTRLTDAQTRDLVTAWARAWDEIAPDLSALLVELLLAGDNISRAQMLRSERLRKSLTLVAAALEDLSQASVVRITRDLQALVDTAGAAQASIIDSQLPPGASQLVDLDAWSKVDPDQLTAIVERTAEQITALHLPLSAEAYDAVRRELVRGIAAGTNPRATAGRMVARARSGFNGGLTRALTIARTESLDAHRAAAALGQAPHADVLAGWQWVAALGARTCAACFSKHGTVYDLTEPGPQGHQQCRCSRVPVVKPWADLGITAEEPPSLLPDADAVFDGLPVADQKAILGGRGWEAWSRGEWPRGQWAVRRRTPGWRDSWVPGVPPAAGQRRGRSAA